MRLTPARVALWALAALAIGVGAFVIGQSGGSHPESPSPRAADSPQPMTLPRLTAVAPLPSMRATPHHRQQPDETGAVGEEGVAETPPGTETYETPVEESFEPEESESSSGSEAAAPPAAEPTETQTEPAPTTGGGGGGELIGEG